jgi:hypothetical protein
MSQSDSTEDSMGTQPFKYVEMTSIQQEEEEEDDDQVETEPTAMVTKEEIETMVECIHQTLNILLHLNNSLNYKLR